MKMKKALGIAMLMGALLVTACNSPKDSSGSSSGTKPTSSQQSSSSGGAASTTSSASTAKSVSISSIDMANEDGKAYVVVTGTQANYTAAEFKWAWGLKVNGDAGQFIDGKETPEAADYKAAEFDATTKAFTVKYCLTDLTTLTSGAFYQVYGGTPETYDNIPFENTNAGARDQNRHYYLRTDQNNSIVFDSVQPISFTKAAIIDVAAGDLPDGTTQAGLYVKFGGVNEAGLTNEIVSGWFTDNKVAGNFQRVIGGSYQLHDHVAAERFFKIEGNDIFFYCYIGFIADGEGWQTHFDCVSGNSGANLQFDSTFWGDADHTYTFGSDTYRLYADKSKGTEAEFWGCLGVARNVEA